MAGISALALASSQASSTSSGEDSSVAMVVVRSMGLTVKLSSDMEPSLSTTISRPSMEMDG
ncbi:hypothetical protein D3C72_2551410 [compost metagenome]